MRSKILKFICAALIFTLMSPSYVRASGMQDPNAPPAAQIRDSQLKQVGDPAPSPSDQEIRADTFGLPLAADETASMYAKPSVFLQQNNKVEFKVTVQQDGLYTIAFEMAASQSFINTPKDSCW